jgi:hypothetical protein
MEPLVDRDDVTAILSGVFDISTRLARIADDVRVIGQLLEDDDGEEEEEEADGSLG